MLVEKYVQAENNDDLTAALDTVRIQAANNAAANRRKQDMANGHTYATAAAAQNANLSNLQNVNKNTNANLESIAATTKNAAVEQIAASAQNAESTQNAAHAENRRISENARNGLNDRRCRASANTNQRTAVNNAINARKRIDM